MRLTDYYENRYASVASVVIGFHGCKKEVANKIFSTNEHLTESSNSYDWLGKGIYFWESNPSRAKEWAETRYEDNWGVVGAFIDLGNCLNLLEQRCLNEVKMAYESHKTILMNNGTDIQKNSNAKNYNRNDFLLRKLDCAVINHIHTLRRESNPYDTVRGVFWEGNELYENAGFKERNHIQISVVNPNCILGYFRPRCWN